MTEYANNTPFTGIMVKARKMPDLMWPRFQKWYRTTTWISEDANKYVGHQVKGGRNFQGTAWGRRPWHTNTPPTRVETEMSADVAFDLSTPFYMLADTAGATSVTEDTIVGPDYCNLPIKLHQDLIAMNAHTATAGANERSMFMRVLAINHKFTFVNHSRFPLEIYYSVLPVGYRFENLSTQFAAHQDMVGLAFKRIVVPAILDAQDTGRKKSVDLSVNLKKLWPDAYDLPPGPEMTSTTAALSTHSRSPWISLIPGATTTCVMLNIPPGQIGDDSWASPDLATATPVCGLRCVWYGKLQTPRDVGATTEDTDFVGGDYVGNNYDVHLDASWLVDVCRTGTFHQIHTGEKAYPNNAA